MNNPELVLVVGDMFVPQRSQDIDPQFKAILIPNKLQHVLSLGNIGSRESYDWLKSLSNDFHSVKGDFDEGDMPEKKLVTIGEFKIGLIHGHQILPWGNAESLSSIQRELDCDILLSGNTHQINVKVVDNKLFINPGSISGAFSNVVADPSPSFVLHRNLKSIKLNILKAQKIIKLLMITKTKMKTKLKSKIKKKNNLKKNNHKKVQNK